MKLNLGSGQNKLDGFTNVDKYDSFSPEVVWDLEKTPWPFDTSSADEITMRHSLEHMGADTETFFSIIKELYRVGKNGCVITIAVPHPRSDNFTGDPTHVRAINPSVMALFSKQRNKEWKEKGWPNTPLGIYLDVDLDLQNVNLSLTPYWAAQHREGKLTKDQLDFAVNTYFNVVDEIRMTIAVRK